MNQKEDYTGHSRERGVCGKVKFDKKSAQTKRNWLMKKGREDLLRIYHCEFCNAWHLTHQEKDSDRR